jgi:hypothetical protein
LLPSSPDPLLTPLPGIAPDFQSTSCVRIDESEADRAPRPPVSAGRARFQARHVRPGLLPHHCCSLDSRTARDILGRSPFFLNMCTWVVRASASVERMRDLSRLSLRAVPVCVWSECSRRPSLHPRPARPPTPMRAEHRPYATAEFERVAGPPPSLQPSLVRPNCVQIPGVCVFVCAPRRAARAPHALCIAFLLIPLHVCVVWAPSDAKAACAWVASRCACERWFVLFSPCCPPHF